MYLTGVRYGGVGPFQEATDLESLHLNGCSFGNRSCSSTVEVKLPRLALTGSSPYVSLREDASPSLFCCKDADDDGNTVIVAVVDGGVGDVLDIVQIDDSDTKLTARCEVCGHKGFFTVRKTFDTRTELIGGVDVYMPVCLKHYINNQIVIKASK
ncbi:hypothetical protein HID58_060547 [Brassica napus]|uniref:Thymidine kinase n=1 Tax=Brassica napus TaxID=3708 RepID=A0ABQ7ZWW6_BRANA|nr:hypothetical protein HID58_060547 [Brassica napus]